MTAGAGARTVAARMMGNALPGGGPEDSSGSATVTHGGAVCRGGPSDEEDQTSSEEEVEENGAKWGVPLAVDLTPEELARRRAAQMKRLLKLYRLQYWGLIEEMRSKHRRYFLRQGTSGWKEEGEGAATEGTMRPVCSKAGCTDRAMPASSFCFQHILCDPRQQLYCACIHSPSPDEPCPRPVLRAVVPALCAQHAALRKTSQSPRQRPSSAGSSAGGATSSSSMLPVPPVHVLMNEYIRVLQRHRTVTAALKQEVKT
ncbi:hypothetical protein KFL_000610440 [Klebsormidium nitens]|uniref:KAT8 regulatory NSL complex subunit 2 n=1 Tax=Klebsormidium nitens TaxID=105231 RepID=A0A0U9HJK2_KLENI|nr:hypothetical protein KFL_000610440 [Klebsormidium nitens]|eukprot:GAQ80766.1 hypothetical protein KFL_000610440 [Klebsormidium nitens]